MTRSADPVAAPRRERGAAILLLIVLLLFAAAIPAIHATRIAMSELRLGANDARAQVAQAAADAGLEAALAALARADTPVMAFDADGRIAHDGPAATLANGADYTTRLHNDGLTPWDESVLVVEARGSAGDGGGARTVRQLTRRDPWLAQAPPAPLVARGEVTLGTGVIGNPAQPYAIWAGAGITLAAPVALTVTGNADCPAACAGDARLAGLSPDAFLANFFGRSPALLAAWSQAYVCMNCPAAAPGGWPRPAWIRGDDGIVTLGAGEAGTPDAPVILVIDGDLVVAADVTIHGVLFVRGDWRAGTGRLTLHGSLLVAGAVLDPGTATLHYDAGILDLLATRGPYVRIAGSWSDF